MREDELHWSARYLSYFIENWWSTSVVYSAMQQFMLNYARNNTTMLLSRYMDYKKFNNAAGYSKGMMDHCDKCCEIRLIKVFIVATKIAAVTRANLLGAQGAAFPSIATVATDAWVLTQDASLLNHDVNAAMDTERAEKWVAGEATAEALAAAELNKAKE